MVRPWCLWIPVLWLGCKTLPDQRPPTAQFMQLPTVPKATRLMGTAENRQVTQAMALVDSHQTCSGVLIGQASTPESPAYLLTAGHCLMDLGVASSSQSIFRDALPRTDRNRIHFSQADFRIGRVVYATMKGVDLAIAEITEDESPASLFRLTERSELEGDEAKVPRAVTLKRMKELGLEPLPWAIKLPAFGDDIRIISAAEGDDSDAEVLREHRCRHEGLADVVESIWHWQALARNNCEDVLPGASGAPVLNKDGAIFAIVNTSSRNALGQDCYLGQPCELTEQNYQVAASRNYGSIVVELPSCFNAQGIFSPEDARCPLERSSSAVVMSQAPTPWNPLFAKAEARRWNVSLQASDPKSSGFRFKSVQLPGQNCQETSGYSERLPWSDQRLRDRPLPTTAGLHALCVISEEEFQRQDLRHPAVIVLNVDNQPPRVKPRLVTQPNSPEPLMAVRKSCRNLPSAASFEQRRQCAVAVLSLEVQPYEIVDFYQGTVASKGKDCQGLKNAGRGQQLHIPVSQLPAQVCVWAVDGAGNRAPEPVIFPIRAATRREIIEATDVMVD